MVIRSRRKRRASGGHLLVSRFISARRLWLRVKPGFGSRPLFSPWVCRTSSPPIGLYRYFTCDCAFMFPSLFPMHECSSRSMNLVADCDFFFGSVARQEFDRGGAASRHISRGCSFSLL